MLRECWLDWLARNPQDDDSFWELLYAIAGEVEGAECTRAHLNIIRQEVRDTLVNVRAERKAKRMCETILRLYDQKE